MSNLNDHPLVAIGSIPVSEASPCGENARYDNDFEQLEAELAKQESLTSETVDWSKVINFSSTIIQHQSKDILVGSYLCYALLLKEGYAGLTVGLGILNDMADQYWDCLFPPVKRLRARQTAYVWLAEKAGLQLIDKVPAADESDAVLLAAEALKQLDNTLVEKMGDLAPMLSDLSRPLKNYQQSAKAEQERMQQQAAVVEEAVIEPESPEVEAKSDQSVPIVEPEIATASPPPAPKPAASPRKPSTSTVAVEAGDLESEADSKKTLRQIQAVSRDIAQFWINQKLTDTRAYRLSRVAAWMVVENAPPDNAGVTQINPPPAERLKFFEATQLKEDYSVLIVELEKTIARAPFWLDGHFLVVKALRSLGPQYDKAVQTVIQETAGFLNRLPEIIDLSFADQTPFVADQTRLWLDTEVLISSGNSGNTGVAVESTTMPWIKALDEASKKAASGSPEEAVSIIQQGLNQAGQQRDQTYWRCTLAQLLIQMGNPLAASNILEQICNQLDENYLATWEPDLFSNIYKLLFQSYQKQLKKNKEDKSLKEKVNRAYEKLCWFDPVAALSEKGG